MVNCTPTVHQYNEYMGAVDYNDKMCRITEVISVVFLEMPRNAVCSGYTAAGLQT